MARPSDSAPDKSGGIDRTTFLLAGIVFMGVFVLGIVLGNSGTKPPAPQAFVQTAPTATSDVNETEVAVKPAKAKPKPKPVGKPPRNCAEARRRGIAPMYEGEPEYGEWMDGDGDGIACEPYHGH